MRITPILLGVLNTVENSRTMIRSPFQHNPESENRPPLRLTGIKLTAPPVRPRYAPMVLHTRVVTGLGGGPDKTILRSTQHIDPAQIRMAAAYIHPHGDVGMATLRKQAHDWGCQMWEISESGAADPRTVRDLFRLCRKLRVAVWHGHDYKTNLLGLLISRWWPMKLVTTVHGWTRHTARTKVYYHVDNWSLSRYDHVVTVSPKLYDHCRGHGIPEERLSYIPNGIELSDYERQQTLADARQRLGIEPNRLVIGTVGRFSTEKSVDRAIRTIAQIRRTRPEAQLHLIGDGPERDRLKALASELGVSDAVRFWGWQAPLQRFYETMDVLLLPSLTEGLPNVVLEAMAMGVPVAATNVGGVTDLLDHGRCGVILNQDQQTWADRIDLLLASETRRTHFADLAQARIASHYTFEQRMARMRQLYQRVLGLETLTAPTPSQPLRKAA